MTIAKWKCPKCGFELMVSLSTFVKTCPKCNQEFKLLKMLRGADLLNQIPVFCMNEFEFFDKAEKIRIPEAFTNEFITFVNGNNKRALEEYFRILRRQRKYYQIDSSRIPTREEKLKNF